VRVRETVSEVRILPPSATFERARHCDRERTGESQPLQRSRHFVVSLAHALAGATRPVSETATFSCHDFIMRGSLLYCVRNRVLSSFQTNPVRPPAGRAFGCVPTPFAAYRPTTTPAPALAVLPGRSRTGLLTAS
jgi:hypothetical protein